PQVANDLDRRPLAGLRPGPPGDLVQLANQQLEQRREARQLAARLVQQGNAISHRRTRFGSGAPVLWRDSSLEGGGGAAGGTDGRGLAEMPRGMEEGEAAQHRGSRPT